jgi:hypothetical protein
MTAPIPAAELIAERSYGGRRSARVMCPLCQHLELHPWPVDTGPVAAHCGLGLIRIGAQ